MLAETPFKTFAKGYSFEVSGNIDQTQNGAQRVLDKKKLRNALTYNGVYWPYRVPRLEFGLQLDFMQSRL